MMNWCIVSFIGDKIEEARKKKDEKILAHTHDVVLGLSWNALSRDSK